MKGQPFLDPAPSALTHQCDLEQKRRRPSFHLEFFLLPTFVYALAAIGADWVGKILNFAGGMIFCLAIVLLAFCEWIEDRDYMKRRQKVSVLPFGALVACSMYVWLAMGWVDWLTLLFFSLMVTIGVSTVLKLIRAMQ